MDPIEPVYSGPVLLLIAAGAVALLLFLVIRLKLHAFIALVLVSLLTALVTGIPFADIPSALLSGFGSTLASVALLVGFGVMIGRLLEVTGGAQVLADTLVARFGEKRAPLALGVASLIFGFPIFFDAGLVVFLPIILTVARRFGGSLLLYALPAAGAFAAMHAFVPPHPGPVAASELLGANIGLTLFVGLLVAIPSWYIGVYLFSRWAGHRFYIPTPAVMGGAGLSDGSGSPDDVRGGTGGGSGHGNGSSPAGTATATATRQETGTPQDLPTFGTVLGILLLPLVLIGLNTGITTLGTAGVIDAEQTWAQALVLLGQTPVALLITLLVAIVVLGRRQGRSWSDVETLLNDSLGPICSIILITGAGGMFGGVLRTSGIGAALSDSLSDLGLPIIVAAFLIATALRVAQGSATVALTTAAGLIAPAVAATDGLSELHLSLVVMAIAAGATVLSHVNDSGFWLVSRFFGMDEKTTLKTWTVMETTLGTTAFLIAFAVWVVI
ncbi:GntP family permease [Aquipuribacter sp. MA13-6]|uniref:GntP family permease n=1 Tax=unclassified Aquipuribacter TaxID=2635084 RepID=UPI003EECA842